MSRFDGRDGEFPLGDDVAAGTFGADVELDGGRDARAPGRNGAFLLTGSQPLGLMKSVSDSLAGRADIIGLEPPSFAEAKAAHPRLSGDAQASPLGAPAALGDWIQRPAPGPAAGGPLSCAPFNPGACR